VIVVVDASVAAMWFLPEPESGSAARLLAATCALVAPDLMRLEVAGVFLKAVRRGMLDPKAGGEALARLAAPSIRFEPVGAYAELAFDVAGAHGGSVYDGAYVALAGALGAVVATNDREMARTARRAGLEAWHLSEPAPAWLDA
jgi:predicted nucleic acid-binding protein